MTKDYVVSSGGKVDAVVMALVKKANDEEKPVRVAIFGSLQEIGRKQPNLVLSSILDFFMKNPGLDQPHRIILLQVLQKVLQQHLDNTNADICQNLIELGMNEMLGKPEIVPEWQSEACELLLVLGTKFSKQIMEKLIAKFTPGKVPHYFVMKLFGDLATHSPNDVVPLLKDVVARSVPITSSIKKDNMRWVFSYAISHFSEAIVHYIANAESDFSMQFVTYGSELYPAYEIMLNVWLNSKESKVRLMTAKAIGNLCAILPREQFETQLPKLMPHILNLFKKEREILPVTQAVCSVLEVGVQSAKAAIAEAEADPNALIPTLALEPMLPTVLNIIHPLCVQPVDESNPSSVKNNNELLRCHEVIGNAFPNALISFLLERLDVTNPKSKDPNTRAGTLLIIRHLVDRIDPSLEGHKELLVIGMKTPCQTEQNLKVQKNLAQVIISMSSKNYLELEGGEELVQFILKVNALSDAQIERAVAALKGKPQSAGTPSHDELRSLCDDILNISSTAVPCMDPVLWPFLFEFVVDPKFTPAAGILAKAIGSLASRKREEWESGEADDEKKDFYLVDFDKHVNLPRPHDLIARWFVLSTGALRRNKQGENVLECLRACGPILNEEVAALWDNALVKLVVFIQSKQDNWAQQKWEDLILRLLAETIKIVSDDSWTMKIGESLAEQLPSYANDPELKANALKQLGLVLQKLNHKQFIRTQLDLMFSSTNHANDAERLGCAQGFGYCAATHLDIALEKVQDQLGGKKKEEKKKGGFFDSFFSGGSSAPPSGDKVRTAMLVFGYITAYSSPKLITSRLEVTILVSMRPQLQKKNITPALSDTLIQTIDLIGKTVHPTHLRVEQFIFKPRDELLRHVLDYITMLPPVKTHALKVRTSGLSAITTLLNLEPALTEELENELVSKIIKFYTLRDQEEVPQKGKKKDDKKGAAPAKVETSPEQLKEIKELYQNLNETLGSIVYMNTTVPCLSRLLGHVEPHARSNDPNVRKIAITTTFYLLERFVEYLSNGIQLDQKEFVNVGKCLSSVVPRVTDSSRPIRIAALRATQYFLFIDYILQNPQEQTDDEEIIEMPEHLDSLSEMLERVESPELSSQFSAANELASVVCEVLSEQELCKLLLSLLDGLTDADASASSGTCIVLNSVIKLRGDAFLPQVGDLISGMLKAMEKISHEKTINGTLHSIRTLSKHHPLPVINALVGSPLPHSSYVVTSLQAISKDEELLEILLDHLLDTLNNSQCVEKGKEGDVASKESCSATCTLRYIFDILPPEVLLEERFAAFFSTLILRFGTTAKVGSEKPRADLIETFIMFVKQIDSSKMEGILKDEISLKSDISYATGVMKLVAEFCQSYPDSVLDMYNFILPYAKGNFPGQRLMVTSAFAEMMNWSKDDEILQNIVNALLISMNDDNLRLQSIIGLGNSAASGEERANKFAASVIDALMSVIDHSDEDICMESMNGLDRVFRVIDGARVQPILINIVHRIRPHFDKKSGKIRASSFRLFGTLCRFGVGSSAELFKQQMHPTFPAVFLHLTDPVRDVQIACKETMRRLVPLYGSEQLNKLVERKWFEANIKLPFDTVSHNFAKIFVKEFAELAPTYVMAFIEFFQSHWPQIRASAATVAGDLLGALPAHDRGTLNPGIVCTAFINLLASSKDADVRESASAAMKLLYDY